MNQNRFARTCANFLILLSIVYFSGCAVQTAGDADELRVDSSSSVFQSAARSLQTPCNNPAEFGRCGCYMDGIKTSCDLVASCLDAGFCKVARDLSNDTATTSQSALFGNTAKQLAPICDNPAEFGRCGCTMDGIKTSCDIVNRCLANGFCTKVSQ